MGQKQTSMPQQGLLACGTALPGLGPAAPDYCEVRMLLRLVSDCWCCSCCTPPPAGSCWLSGSPSGCWGSSTPPRAWKAGKRYLLQCAGDKHTHT